MKNLFLTIVSYLTMLFFCTENGIESNFKDIINIISAGIITIWFYIIIGVNYLSYKHSISRKIKDQRGLLILILEVIAGVLLYNWFKSVQWVENIELVSIIVLPFIVFFVFTFQNGKGLSTN